MSTDDQSKDMGSATQAAGLSGKAAEYVERLVSEHYKRELEQEENVVRSLPFFATSIGVLVTFVGFARGLLPSASLKPWPLLVFGLLSGVLASLASLLYFLYQVVRRREDKSPMHAEEILAYSGSLATYYRKGTEAPDAPEDDGVKLLSPAGADADGPAMESATDQVVEQAIMDDLRNTLIPQIAKAAQASRSNNWARLRARSRAFSALMVALAFALALIVAILVHDAVNGGSYGQATTARSGTENTNAAGQQGDRPGEAKGSGDAHRREGAVELRGGPEGGPGAQAEQAPVIRQTIPLSIAPAVDVAHPPESPATAPGPDVPVPMPVSPRSGAGER